MVFGDSSSSSLQASRKGAFYTYHFHFPLQNSFPFSDTVLFTFQNAQKLRLRSVHTENRSADVDGGRQSGTGNKPRTRTRLDFQMLTKKTSKSQERWISETLLSAPHRLAGDGELSATINRQNPIMGNLIKTYYRTAALKRPTKHTSKSDLQQLQETAPLKSPAHSAVTERRAVCVAPSRHALLQACDSLVLCFRRVCFNLITVGGCKFDKSRQSRHTEDQTLQRNSWLEHEWHDEMNRGEVLTRLQRTQTGCFLHFTLRCRQSQISTLNNICRWPLSEVALVRRLRRFARRHICFSFSRLRRVAEGQPRMKRGPPLRLLSKLENTCSSQPLHTLQTTWQARRTMHKAPFSPSTFPMLQWHVSFFCFFFINRNNCFNLKINFTSSTFSLLFFFSAYNSEAHRPPSGCERFGWCEFWSFK